MKYNHNSKHLEFNNINGNVGFKLEFNYFFIPILLQHCNTSSTSERHRMSIEETIVLG